MIDNTNFLPNPNQCTCLLAIMVKSIHKLFFAKNFYSKNFLKINLRHISCLST